MVKVLLAALLVIVSFSAGYLIKQKSESLPFQDSYKGKYEKLSAEIAKIHGVDIQEYMELREQKELYLKADEILGKILLLFLAETGLKLSQKEIAHFKGNKMPLPTTTELDSSSLHPGKKEASPCGPLKTAGADIDTLWLKAEKGGKVSEDDLKSLEVGNLFSVIKSAKPYGADLAQKLEGHYEGSINLEKPTARVWVTTLDFEITGESAEGIVEGNYKFTLAEPNKPPFSSSSGDGTQDQFTSPSGSQAIFVKIRSESKENYLQLYSVDGGKKLIGNYYNSKSMDEFEKTGTVTLWRR